MFLEESESRPQCKHRFSVVSLLGSLFGRLRWNVGGNSGRATIVEVNLGEDQDVDCDLKNWRELEKNVFRLKKM